MASENDSKCKSVFRKFIYIPLFFILLTSLTHGQDDDMMIAIQNIWPQKNVKVLKDNDDSLGVTTTVYAASVTEGGYEYQVAVHVVPPDNVPPKIIKILNAQPPDTQEFEIEDLEAPAWISLARDSFYLNDDGTRRKNIYIIQNVEFKCVNSNIYVTTSINKDKGSTVIDPSSQYPDSAYTKDLTAKFTPISKEFAKRVASAVIGNTDCGGVYAFYKEFLSINKSGFEFGKKYRDGKDKAFKKYPCTQPGETKQAMLRLLREGFEPIEKMWAMTASIVSLGPDPGMPPDYGRFIKHLAGLHDDTCIGLQNGIDPVVRRFRHYARRHDMQIIIGKKIDKPMKDILVHVLEGQVNKISGKITENAIDAAALVLIDENKKSLFDPAKAKYYVDLLDFTNSSLEPKAEGHKVAIDYLGLHAKYSKNKKVEKGVGIIKEALFFIPALIELYDIQIEYNSVSRSFDQLQRDFPDTRIAYEKALLRLNLIRYAMRDKTAQLKKLQEKNKDQPDIAFWPEKDREIGYQIAGYKLVGGKRSWSMLEELMEAHTILFEELKEKKDDFILTWYLLGYPKDTVPKMEVIY